MLYNGDLFAVLQTLAAASIDACVTDPPYGIGFMGREWDTFKPSNVASEFDLRQRKEFKEGVSSANIKGRKRSPAASPSQIQYDYTVVGLREFQAWTKRWAVEVFRVLKPGAYLVVCGAPRSYHRMACGLEDAGFVVRDQFAWLFGSGFPKNYNLGDGKGTALKPAHEPIALAWKPFKGSIKACHEAHGTAALNIDACRMETADEWPAVEHQANDSIGTFKCKQRTTEQHPLGRWPANVVIDDEAAAALDEQTGELVSGANPTRRGSDKFRDTYGEFKGQTECGAARGLDVGGASRFYYVAKPSREERDYGCHERNTHPTVKPVELMRWLVKLVTPPDGVVLDPFMGSGTTGMACRYEQRQFVGVEREAEYIQIAEHRIAAVAPLFTETEEPDLSTRVAGLLGTVDGDSAP